MLLSDIENAVRLDLFDPAGASQRWSNADLDRSIDRAVERYSQYYPNIAYADMQAQPYQRTYPYPASWNANCPVLWLERVLYPLQAYGTTLNAPTSGASLALAAGAGLGLGLYKYTLTFLTQGGETTPSPLTQITTTSGNQVVNLTNIPTASANSNNSVIGRNLYRTSANGNIPTLLATLADNTTTSYTDSTSDASIASTPGVPVLNTSGVMLWPARSRAFAEYSGLYDGANALASSGNMGGMGGAGRAASALGANAPAFTLALSDAELPRDNTILMRIFYATRHQLDAQGCTVPEIHCDIITLGACAYALEAYQTPTNDNFAFQNGGVNDRFDDTAIPSAWLRASQNRMKQFQQRLEEIKRQRAVSSISHTNWGRIHPRWWRV
ncbi:hypothetical protein [Ktedonospora formicarum]|uniref:Uncharacterized protein n=1 Tax=Ktedonospora formicarum TaxID=2778364 RepID=A0A8J3I6K8_9CHLR|nr:hypothetical protein [Ktedonospora formicarum]GHO49611.1 hypothetical protein KSX_77740 [Ktedonospora formicarum]